MKDFNSYLDNLDYSLVKDLFHEKGKQRIYHKKDFFIRQNEISRFAEWVENGTFNIHILMERVKNTLLDTLSPTSLYVTILL